jgi:hypothetical protein
LPFKGALGAVGWTNGTLYDLSGEKDIARRIRDIQQLGELGAVIAHFSSPDGSFTSLMLDTSGQIIRAYDAVKETV